MYTLYYAPGACSLAVHVLLQEIGADYQLERVPLGDKAQQSSDFRRINPRGSIPVLKTPEGHIIREGGAILLYLSEQHPHALLPASGSPGRAAALEWLLYANSSLHPMAGRIFFAGRALPDGDTKQQTQQAMVTALQGAWDELDNHLASSKFLAGEQITLADVLVTVISGWMGRMPGTITMGENLQRVFTAVQALPSWQRAVDAEKPQARRASA